MIAFLCSKKVACLICWHVQQIQTLHAAVPAVSYNDMVYDHYSKKLSAGHKPFGGHYILLTRLRISAWVIMYKDYSRSTFFDSLAENLSGVN